MLKPFPALPCAEHAVAGLSCAVIVAAYYYVWMVYDAIWGVVLAGDHLE